MNKKEALKDLKFRASRAEGLFSHPQYRIECRRQFLDSSVITKMPLAVFNKCLCAQIFLKQLFITQIDIWIIVYLTTLS